MKNREAGKTVFTISPVMQRRIDRFKQNKRGKWSLYIFIFLFFVSVFADFIAGERPIIVYYKQQIYMPIFKVYSEKEFGGDFETEADYRDHYVKGLINSNGFMIWPLIPYGCNTINYDLPTPAPSRPDSENLLGTDDQGRDVLARLIHGYRISIFFALILTLLSAVIGILAGAIQGYLGGMVDLLFQRFIEIWSGLPILFILIILGSFVKPTIWWLLFIMLLFRWMYLVGVVRAEFLKARNLEFVKAAKVLGVPTFTIILRHILPNAMVATITYLPFMMNGAIALLTALDFLGFGLPPGSPSLGEMIAQGKNNLHSPWLGITAFFAIAFLMSILVFIGEAVRDAFDPKKAGQNNL